MCHTWAIKARGGQELLLPGALCTEALRAGSGQLPPSWVLEGVTTVQTGPELPAGSACLCDGRLTPRGHTLAWVLLREQ